MIEPLATDPVAPAEPALLPPAVPPSSVTLRGVTGQLVLDLDPTAPFERLRDDARAVLGEIPGRFKGSNARLNLGTREIALFDLRRLVHALKDEFDVTVTGLYLTAAVMHRFTEQELKLKVFLAEPSVEAAAAEEEPTSEHGTVPAELLEEEVDAPAVVAPAPPAPAPELPSHRMFPVERTVRSGATVRYQGDIVVYGDVNAGAQVLATGNILVLGSLRGLAHAGLDGDERAVIIGFDLRPMQLRIGKKIAISPDVERGRRGHAEIAWVSGDEIVIEEYRGRLPG